LELVQDELYLLEQAIMYILWMIMKFNQEDKK